MSPNGRGSHIHLPLAGGFKRGLGAAGLSQDVQGMHNGRLLALQKLFAENTISRAQYAVATSLETLKYPLRVLRVARDARTSSHRRDKPQTVSPRHL